MVASSCRVKELALVLEEGTKVSFSCQEDQPSNDVTISYVFRLNFSIFILGDTLILLNIYISLFSVFR